MLEYDSLPSWSLWVIRWHWRSILDWTYLKQCDKGCGGFGLDLFFECSLLSESVLNLCSMVDVNVILCSPLTDNYLGHHGSNHVLPSCEANVALLSHICKLNCLNVL